MASRRGVLATPQTHDADQSHNRCDQGIWFWDGSNAAESEILALLYGGLAEQNEVYVAEINIGEA